jgi:hypothetical protein
MRRGIITMLAVGLIAGPAVAFAGENSQGNEGDHGGVALTVARLQCRNDRANLGLAAFRQRFGPRHAFANCVRAHLPADRTATQTCRTERRQLGGRAFRAKYGTPDALKACVIAKVGTT